MEGWSVAAVSAAVGFVGAAAGALGAALGMRYRRRDVRLRTMQDAVADSVFRGRDLTDEEREKIRQFLARERDEADTEEWWVVGEPPESSERRDV
ncbi:hypothetical protein [Streptomyces sp. MZ04]|uniref:hypothetical protein n=1 Tax=Streptomyces sp. MZ04 TaxID=2559236 RepID=UPI00107E68F0|nr:hypothetical protein [Streptomyces sp. MZ04]TGB02128.1 hypothetical protein E2651_26980 [Streptomyces sp. MZ04]